MVAGFTPQQQQGFADVQNAEGIGTPYIDAAAQEFSAATNPLWQTLPSFDTSSLPGAGTTGINSAFGAAQAGSTYNIQPYLSPYTSNVTDALTNLYNNQNATQQSQVQGNAISGNALGGDRQAVAQALTAQQQNLSQAPTLANVEQSGFQQAQNEANSQQALELQSGQLGLGAGQAGFGEYNQQQQQQLSAEQADAWLQSQAGFGMAGLGTQAQTMALTGANADLSAGAQQQQLGQEQLNIPYQQFTAAQAYPYQELGFLSPIVEGTGSLSGGTGSTTTPGPSTLSQIGGLGLAGIGGLGATGAFGSNGYLTNAFGSTTPGVASGTIDSGLSDLTSPNGLDYYSSKHGGRIGFAAGGVTVPLLPPGIGPGVPNISLSYIPQAAPGGTPNNSSMSAVQPDVNDTTTTSTPSSGILGDLGSIFSIGKGVASLFVKDGGRTGYDGGGSIGSATPAASQLPAIPAINIDYIVPPGPVTKGSGPPKGPNASPQRDSTTSDVTNLANEAKSLKSSGVFGGSGTPSSSSNTSDITDAAAAQGGRIGFDSGGGVPLSVAAQFGGAPPNLQGAYQQLAQLPLSQLQQMSVQFPPNTQQGQMIAQALRMKQATPGSGTAPASPQAGGSSGGAVGGAQAGGAQNMGGIGSLPNLGGSTGINVGTATLARGGRLAIGGMPPMVGQQPMVGMPPMAGQIPAIGGPPVGGGMVSPPMPGGPMGAPNGGTAAFATSPMDYGGTAHAMAGGGAASDDNTPEYHYKHLTPLSANPAGPMLGAQVPGSNDPLSPSGVMPWAAVQDKMTYPRGYFAPDAAANADALTEKSRDLASGGDASNGYVTEDELDPHPVVDHSGDTVKIRYPSEGKVLDLGIPSVKTRNHFAAGGTSGGAATPQVVYNNGQWSVLSGTGDTAAGPAAPQFAALPGYSIPTPQTYAGTGGTPIQGPGQNAPQPGTGAGTNFTTLPGANGVAVPQLSGSAFGANNPQLAGMQPGGGLGNWFQPMSQYQPPGTTTANGVTSFPSQVMQTPGMASVISGLTPGAGIPVWAGGSPAAPAAAATATSTNATPALTPDQVAAQAQAADAAAQQADAGSGGGGKRGGRFGYDDGGDTSDDSPDGGFGANISGTGATLIPTGGTNELKAASDVMPVLAGSNNEPSRLPISGAQLKEIRSDPTGTSPTAIPSGEAATSSTPASHPPEPSKTAIVAPPSHLVAPPSGPKETTDTSLDQAQDFRRSSDPLHDNLSLNMPQGGIGAGSADAVAKPDQGGGIGSDDVYAVGDSHAGGLIRFGGATGSMGKTPSVANADAANGRNPTDVYKYIMSQPDSYWQGKKVVLSTGVSNDPSQGYMVPYQIAGLQKKGADLIGIAGFGPRGMSGTDMHPVADEISGYASAAGIGSGGVFENNLMPDQVHLTPQGYKQVGGWYKSEAPATGSAAQSADTGASSTASPGVHGTGVAAPSEAGASQASTPVGDYIRQGAIARGLDPNMALHTANTEGKTGEFQLGDNGSSGGAFQLHLDDPAKPGAGTSLGDQFYRDTGKNPLDPNNHFATIDYALDYAKAHGGTFDPNIWHGLRNNPNPGSGDSGMIANVNPRRGGIGSDTGDQVVTGDQVSNRSNDFGTDRSGGLGSNTSNARYDTYRPQTMQERFQQNWPMLALATGAGMLASRSPFPGVALGEGLKTGLSTYNTETEQSLRENQLVNEAQYRNADLALKQQAAGPENRLKAAQATSAEKEAALKTVNMQLMQEQMRLAREFAGIGASAPASPLPNDAAPSNAPITSIPPASAGIAPTASSPGGEATATRSPDGTASPAGAAPKPPAIKQSSQTGLPLPTDYGRSPADSASAAYDAQYRALDNQINNVRRAAVLEPGKLTESQATIARLMDSRATLMAQDPRMAAAKASAVGTAEIDPAVAKAKAIAEAEFPVKFYENLAYRMGVPVVVHPGENTITGFELMQRLNLLPPGMSMLPNGGPAGTASEAQPSPSGGTAHPAPAAPATAVQPNPGPPANVPFATPQDLPADPTLTQPTTKLVPGPGGGMTAAPTLPGLADVQKQTGERAAEAQKNIPVLAQAEAALDSQHQEIVAATANDNFYTPGAFSDARKRIGTIINTVAANSPEWQIDPKELGEATAIDKAAFGLSTQAVHGISARPAQIEWQSARNSVPNNELPAFSALLLSNTLRFQNQYQKGQAEYELQQYKGGADPSTAATAWQAANGNRVAGAALAQTYIDLAKSRPTDPTSQWVSRLLSIPADQRAQAVEEFDKRFTPLSKVDAAAFDVPSWGALITQLGGHGG